VRATRRALIGSLLSALAFASGTCDALGHRTDEREPTASNSSRLLALSASEQSARSPTAGPVTRGAPTEENERVAATLRASLATQLVTVSLGILSVVGAFVTFTLDRRHARLGFFACTAMAAALIFASVGFGALALDALQDDVTTGVYFSDDQLSLLQLQTVSLGLGVIILPFAFAFAGRAKADDTAQLRTQLQELASEVDPRGG